AGGSGRSPAGGRRPGERLGERRTLGARAAGGRSRARDERL
ncbi:MAG: hypothetical protein AVDCRST_MAG01-01-2834, partial [uncultured Rubrobacteraceae bacterium]